MGRHPKLDDAALDTIREAFRLGLSDRETYQAVGIPERTWFKWKERARAASLVLPEEWRRLKFDELVACCEDLGIDLSRVVGHGAGGRHTRNDLVKVLAERGELYARLFREIEGARPLSKLAMMRRLEDHVEGRVKILKTRTTQRVRFERRGGKDVPVPVKIGEPADAVITTEEVHLPPDRGALIRLLEARFPEEFGRLARAAGGEGGDHGAAARELTAAVHRMLGTISPPPAAPEDEKAGKGGAQ